MSSIVLFDSFVQEAMNKSHDLSTDTLKVALSNTLPSASDTVFSDITEISAGGGYSAGGETLLNVTSVQTSGVYALEADNVVINSSGSGFGPFQFAILYNASAGNKLIGYWDNGSSLSAAPPNFFRLSFTNRDVFIIQ